MDREIKSLRQLAKLVAETASKKKFEHELFIVEKKINFGKFKGKTIEGIQGCVPNGPDIFLKGASEKKINEIKEMILSGKDFSTNSIKRPDKKIHWRIV